jgi:hypothetical protein
MDAVPVHTHQVESSVVHAVSPSVRLHIKITLIPPPVLSSALHCLARSRSSDLQNNSMLAACTITLQPGCWLDIRFISNLNVLPKHQQQPSLPSTRPLPLAPAVPHPPTSTAVCFGPRALLAAYHAAYALVTYSASHYACRAAAGALRARCIRGRHACQAHPLLLHRCCHHPFLLHGRSIGWCLGSRAHNIAFETYLHGFGPAWLSVLVVVVDNSRNCMETTLVPTPSQDGEHSSYM